MSNPYDTQQIEYDMSNLERHSTYDQFLSLRDTLVFSWKRYAWKGWCILCVWEKEKTVEIIWRNLYRQLFDDITQPTENVFIWPYIKFDADIMSNVNFGNLGWVVQKDWWYRLTYKIEVLPTSTQNKVYTYFDIYRPKANPAEWDPFPYDLTEPGWTAVFDWECNTGLSWSTSWTEPNGSCYVPITLWRIFKKLTASWYIKKNLKKGDVIVLRAKDAERWANPLPNGNDLTFQPSSNYLSIEYLNLHINV